MKTIVSTFALSFALCAAAGATARTGHAVAAPAADTVLLSETTDGDYIVRRVLVRSRNDSDYSVRYRINLATLNAALNGNSKELDELGAFVGGLNADTLKQVSAVTVTGYSSPDGPVKFNETLAARRANDFRAYLDRRYGFSKKYDVTVNSVAEDWEMCRTLVAQSSVPDKQAVLGILDSRQSPDQKELALKKMTAAWDYMKEHILPPLRRVELTIDYRVNSIVEQRTLIPRPRPEPQPAQPAEPYVVVDEQINGIIVEMPGEHEYGKEFRWESREARREAREAQKIARRQERAARKIAKMEAKAARKAGNAAKVTYRELENM